MLKDNFYTFGEYMKKENHTLTASMEDYLEMIYRLSLDSHFTRIHDLSTALNVQPPSATKMVQKMSEYDLIHYEKYGIITLTDKGTKVGAFLLDRHNTIENFLKLIGISSNLLEQTEQIEHTLNEETLDSIKNLVNFITSDSVILENYMKFCKKIIKS
jgi:Mn-dependent DtxR family transcriptional regulator